MLDITTGHRPYDISGLKFVDLTDKDDPAENTYAANVTTLSTLRRIVNGDYDVTASIYVNADNEVTALFITNIDDKASGSFSAGAAQANQSITLGGDATTINVDWTDNGTALDASKVSDLNGKKLSATYTPSSRALSAVSVEVTFTSTAVDANDNTKVNVSTSSTYKGLLDEAQTKLNALVAALNAAGAAGEESYTKVTNIVITVSATGTLASQATAKATTQTYTWVEAGAQPPVENPPSSEVGMSFSIAVTGGKTYTATWGNQAGTQADPKIATITGVSGIEATGGDNSDGVVAITVTKAATDDTGATLTKESGTEPTATADGALAATELVYKVVAEDGSVCYYKVTITLTAGAGA